MYAHALAALAITGPRWPAIALGALALALSVLWAARGAVVGRWGGLILGGLASFFMLFAATASPPSLGGGGGELAWHEDLERGLAEARRRDLPALIDFTATWCNACHELEAEIFDSPLIAPRLRRDFVLIKIDFDRAVESQRGLLARYQVHGLPRVAFARPEDGALMAGPSFEGKLNREEFERRLDEASAGGGARRAPGFGRALEEGGIAWALALVFGAGVLASLTPCVYPMIPITVGVFGARGARSRRRAFGLSAIYVLGMASVYAALGASAALVGELFGGLMQSAWVQGAIALLFATLALSTAGVVAFRVPAGLSEWATRVGGGGWLGAAAMGAVAGVIAAPCVGPVVTGILVYAAERQSPALGGALLFVFALGMGQLFLAIGTFSGLAARLPRSGAWMEGVKAALGALFLGAALYYARFVLPWVGRAAFKAWSALIGA